MWGGHIGFAVLDGHLICHPELLPPTFLALFSNCLRFQRKKLQTAPLRSIFLSLVESRFHMYPFLTQSFIKVLYRFGCFSHRHKLDISMILFSLLNATPRGMAREHEGRVHGGHGAKTLGRLPDTRGREPLWRVTGGRLGLTARRLRPSRPSSSCRRQTSATARRHRASSSSRTFCIGES